MTSIFISTIFLDAKKTTAISVIVMFVMFFIGDFSSFMNPSLGNALQYFSTWFYYNPAKIFGAGNFVYLANDVFVLLTINIALIATSLFVIRKRNIPI
jgi:hypothetical protein